jgi:hypothetical protein
MGDAFDKVAVCPTWNCQGEMIVVELVRDISSNTGALRHMALNHACLPISHTKKNLVEAIFA